MQFCPRARRSLTRLPKPSRCHLTCSWTQRFGGKRRMRDKAQCLLRLLVGIDQVAGLVLRRREHGLRVHATELLEVTALDVVVLDLQHAACSHSPPLPNFTSPMMVLKVVLPM